MSDDHREVLAVVLHDYPGCCTEVAMKELYGEEEGERMHREFHSRNAGQIILALGDVGFIMSAKGLDPRSITDETVSTWLRQALDMDEVRAGLDREETRSLVDDLRREKIRLRVIRSLVVEASSEASMGRINRRARRAIDEVVRYADGEPSNHARSLEDERVAQVVGAHRRRREDADTEDARD